VQPLDIALFRRAKAGDPDAREALFHANTGLIWACLRKYTGLIEKDDLFQLGAIGLLKAVDRFDPTFGVSFSTYAVPHILGEIRRYLRDNTPLKVERRLKEISNLARNIIDKRRAITGRDPSAQEVAEELGISCDTLIEAMEATSPLSYLEELPSFGDRVDLNRESRAGGDIPDSIELADALSSLDAQLKSIVEGRFFHGKTQSEIAVELGISQAHVCRLERAALVKLRVYLSAREEILP
jgi:RNA polymerase sporulation-specific sigma factor